MKVAELITELQRFDPNSEAYFTSCCFPVTRWFRLVAISDDELEIEGFSGSYIVGGPDESPWEEKP